MRSFALGGFLRRQHDGLYDQRVEAVRQVVRRRLGMALGGQALTSLLTGHLSPGDNIALGRHEQYDERDAVEAAARRTGAHGFLSSLTAGYDTRLGPRFRGGTDLSGGQWQRLALARALFRDAPFVILDEPIAAIDPRAERELFDDIRRVFTGRSVLLVSHRFANVRTADGIYVLKDGAVVEHGDHDALIAAGGLYAELFTLQAATYLGST